jgi:hypothetical protein
MNNEYVVIAEEEQSTRLNVFSSKEDAAKAAKELCRSHAAGDRYIVCEVLQVHSLETAPQPIVKDSL